MFIPVRRKNSYKIEEIEVRINTVRKTEVLSGMTVNERLFATGLLKEFEQARQNDKEKARIILELLGITCNFIDKII